MTAICNSPLPGGWIKEEQCTSYPPTPGQLASLRPLDVNAYESIAKMQKEMDRLKADNERLYAERREEKSDVNGKVYQLMAELQAIQAELGVCIEDARNTLRNS